MVINTHLSFQIQTLHDNLNTGAYFSEMERGVFIVGKDMGGEYQITQALEGDIFASYFAPITSWGYAPHNNDHYALYQGWYNAPFNDAYEKVMTPWKSIYDATNANSPARAMLGYQCHIIPKEDGYIFGPLLLSNSFVIPQRP